MMTMSTPTAMVVSDNSSSARVHYSKETSHLPASHCSSNAQYSQLQFTRPGGGATPRGAFAMQGKTSVVVVTLGTGAEG